MRTVGMIIGFIVFLFALAGYADWHLWRMAPQGWKLAAVILFVLWMASFFLGFAYVERLPLRAATILYEVGNTWLIAFMYLLIVFFLADLASLCHLLPKAFLKDSPAGLLSVLGLVALILVLGGIHYHQKYREEITLTTTKPLEKPLTIVMASDLHIGYHNGKAELGRWVDLVNAEQPDLVLIGGENLEHAWKQGRCSSPDIREITIQFSADLFPESLLSRNQFASIRRMLEKSRMGLSFPMNTIMDVYSTLNGLAGMKEKFYQYMQFMLLMYKLSLSDDAKVLASSSFSHSEKSEESDRVQMVKQYIDEHFMEDLTLTTLADMVCMTPSAFSRFFKTRTGRTLSDYIIDIRLGHAARMLVDTSKGVSEICYECGFNNQSNFNRIFKSKRGLTPRDFRAMFKKNKVIV